MENLHVNPISHGLFQTLFPKGEDEGRIGDYRHKPLNEW